MAPKQTGPAAVISVRLPLETYERLEEAATAAGVSRSAFCATAIHAEASRVLEKPVRRARPPKQGAAA